MDNKNSGGEDGNFNPWLLEDRNYFPPDIVATDSSSSDSLLVSRNTVEFVVLSEEDRANTDVLVLRNRKIYKSPTPVFCRSARGNQRRKRGKRVPEKTLSDVLLFAVGFGSCLFLSMIAYFFCMLGIYAE